MEDPNAWLSTIMAPERFFLNLAYPPFQDWSETFSPAHLIENQMEVFIANTLNLYYMPLFFMKFFLPEQEPKDEISILAKKALSSKKRAQSHHSKVIRERKS
ncbi:hypothetical protein [Legionella cincinnatiensis]|uniref:Uncharacterized protein n=1 Tax=Legionella cincinnatiensis TaxID=28085 RepID=A0A378IKH4_9GAMM|nr:hypothetical protein [Legionella cincinnatiensis]KTC82095.1 hypothetical protein Lcin_3165 [Legionella cincinnatiensis]STX35430.1 Uncharacterised protein [Legionella cincinnatiensis]